MSWRTGWMAAVLFLSLPPAEGTQLAVSLTATGASGEAAEPFPAVLRAAPVAASRQAPLAWDVRVPGEIEITLPPGNSWELTVEAPGRWSPRLALAERSTAASLSLWPAGRVAGSLHPAQPAERPPAELLARFEPAPGAPRRFPPSRVRCPVAAGRFDCQVPAVPLDLRLEAAGFVPGYYWGVEVQTGKSTDLGRLPLRRGASVVGFVEVEPGGERGALRPAVVLAPRRLLSPGSRAAQERLGLREVSAPVNARGFFQVQGLPAGEYDATARLAGWTAASSSLRLVAGQESQLPAPLRLVRPVPLAVHLTPALDAYGHVWQIEVLRQGSSAQSLERVAAGPANPAGVFRKEALPPGAYEVRVKDFAGSVWASSAVGLTAASPPLELSLDLIPLTGSISLGGEPLATTLWFHNSRVRFQRLRIDSGEDGELSGLLPAEGRWEVDRELAGGDVQALEPVEVRRAPGAASARVEIRLPDTRLKVRVRDDRGRAVESAEVVVMGPLEKRRREAQARTDAGGEVRLSGMSPGLLRLAAFEGSRSSEWRLCELGEGEETTLDLVLAEKVRLRGRVLAAEGAVPGAMILVRPRLDGRPNALQGKAVSEADGSFQMALDSWFAGGSGAVFAPGFGVRMVEVPPVSSRGEEWVVTVSQDAGTLVVDLPRQSWVDAELFHAGARLMLSTFLVHEQARRGGDGRYVLERMEPGPYGLCPGRDSPPADCVTGILPPGGELTLSLRQPPRGEEGR